MTSIGARSIYEVPESKEELCFMFSLKNTVINLVSHLPATVKIIVLHSIYLESKGNLSIRILIMKRINCIYSYPSTVASAMKNI